MDISIYRHEKWLWIQKVQYRIINETEEQVMSSIITD
jgi:hypothetical protein